MTSHACLSALSALSSLSSLSSEPLSPSAATASVRTSPTSASVRLSPASHRTPRPHSRLSSSFPKISFSNASPAEASLRLLSYGRSPDLGTSAHVHVHSLLRKSRSLKIVAGATDSDYAKTSVSSKNETSVSSLGLSIEETPLPNSKLNLKITVPLDTCKRIWKESITEIVGRLKSLGIKKTSKMSEKQLFRNYGEKKAKSFILDNLLNETLPQALSKYSDRAISDSEKILTSVDELTESISQFSSLTYEASIELAPEVKWSSDRVYANMKVDVEYDDIDCEKEAEFEFKDLIINLGSLRIAPHSGIQMGDVAIIDVSASRVNEDGTLGESIESIQQKGFQVDTAASHRLLNGFVPAILGLEREKSVRFSLTLPSDWHLHTLRGVTASFLVECKEHFVRVLPEIDDSLAPKISPSAKTIAEIKEALVSKYKGIFENKKKQAIDSALINELCKICDVDVPKSLIDEQGRQLYAIQLIDLQVGGNVSPEELKNLSSAAMVESFLNSKQNELKNEVIKSLAVADIFRREKLSFTSGEVENEINNAVSEFEKYGQPYDKNRIKEQAIELLEAEKVLEFLHEHSQFTFSPKP